MHTQTLERPTVNHTQPATQASIKPSRPVPPNPPKTESPPTPEGLNLSRLLHALYDPDNHTPRLCDLFDIDIGVLSDALLSDQIDHAIGLIEKLSDLRTRLLRAEAEHTAMARLIDLAGNFPTTPREKETSRKAAAQLLRILKSEPRGSARADSLEPAQSKPRSPEKPDREGEGGSEAQCTPSTPPTQSSAKPPPDRTGEDRSGTSTPSDATPRKSSPSATGSQPVSPQRMTGREPIPPNRSDPPLPSPTHVQAEKTHPGPHQAA